MGWRQYNNCGVPTFVEILQLRLVQIDVEVDITFNKQDCRHTADVAVDAADENIRDLNAKRGQLRELAQPLDRQSRMQPVSGWPPAQRGRDHPARRRCHGKDGRENRPRQ